MTINRNNYEEYFLLYVDRELSADERLEVVHFVQQHPDLEKDLAVLKETVAIAPVLVYEDKESLLRTEKKRGLIPVYWMHIAATLIVLLAGGWFLLLTGKIGKKDESITPSKEIAANQTAKRPELQSPAIVAKEKLAIGANPASGNFKSRIVERTISDKSKNLKSVKTNSENETKHLETLNENNGLVNIPQTAIDLPPVAQQITVSETSGPVSIPSTVNRQPSTVLPSTIHYPPSTKQEPDQTTSILVFDNKGKAVTGFFKKLMNRSPDADATADNHHRKVSVSVFQFSIKK